MEPLIELTPDHGPMDRKYMVFKRDEFTKWLTHVLQLPDAHVVDRILVSDAVVIRRQDKFASPCLATYAAMIAMVAKEHHDPEIQANLLAVSDYFEDQARFAAEEGFKYPD